MKGLFNHSSIALTTMLAVLLLMLVSNGLYANKQQQTVVYYSNDLRTETLGDSLFTTGRMAAVIDTFKVRRPQRPAVKYSNSTLSLFVNPDLAVPHHAAFTVKVVGFIQTISANGASNLGAQTPFELTIDYDPVAGMTYRQRDAITFEDAVYTLVHCKFTLNGNPLSASVPDSLFRFEIHTLGEVFYNPEVSAAPTYYSIQAQSEARHIRMQWSSLEWAEYYELEYVHVDDYSRDGGSRERASLRYDFRQDAIRVRVHTNEYELPIVFEQGYLVARVRAVGMQGRDLDVPAIGRWSLSENGTIPDMNCTYRITAELAHEADRLNWIYNSTFNESGMRSEAVSYADGTSRTRQQVASSHEESKVLVSETFYDHAGRTALTALPAPIKPGPTRLTPSRSYTIGPMAGIDPGSLALSEGTTTGLLDIPAVNMGLTGVGGISTPYGLSPSVLGYLGDHLEDFQMPDFIDLFLYRTQRARLGFVPNFNLNAEGENFVRADYDGDTHHCDEEPVIFGTQSGAGRYYSPENEERARWQAFVPDAEGYPYVQVKYTNDGTGKVKESSLPGATHRSGRGKTKRYFYGTPAQQEMDCYFGNDAGRSSFYRKTLMIDENKQGHVSISDLKGNLVLSALTGARPDNLEAITDVEQARVSINLIEENNVLNRAENSWFSGKRLVLAAPTDVELAYSVVSPAYNDRYCTDVPFCYDCIYDLEVSITDNCGVLKYHQVKMVGKLNDIAQCGSFEVNLDTNIRLEQGSYFIAKKLTVNEAAIDAYTADHREKFTCRNDISGFMPDVDAACNGTCNTCQLTTFSAVFRRRSDGSNPSLYFNKRNNDNSSDCSLTCTQNGGISEWAKSFQWMLADVSPGGQYGEYRDTLNRDADNPLGPVNASVFALSVFNEANRLPILNANWRTPAYDYQTRTGETAYIVLAADGTPAHRSPAAEIRRVDGKQYVLPKYLNDLSDFIRFWEPQWAEALVVYHPEYEYYQWSKDQFESFRFDSLLRVTDTQAAALILNLIGTTHDPFFRASPSLRSAMEDRLINYVTASGTTFSAAQLAIASVHCGNPNFNASQFLDCYSSKTLFGTDGAENKEWNIYKQFYLRTKQIVLTTERNSYVLSRGGFDNRSIGGTRDVAADMLYAGKRRVFADEESILNTLDADVDGEEPTEMELVELMNRAQVRNRECGVCPTGMDLLTLLNSLLIEGQLTTASLTLPGLSPLNLTRDLVNSFPDRTALSYDWKLTTDPSGNTLKYEISTGGVRMCELTLQKSKSYLQWDRIQVFDCLTPTGEYTFTLRAIDALDTTDVIQCRSTCFKMTGCDHPRYCEPLATRNDMKVFLQYLFSSDRYRQTALTVHGEHRYSPYFGPELRRQHPTGKSWLWTFGGFPTGTRTAFNARMRVTTGLSSTAPMYEDCNFSFTIVEPGFSFDSLAHVISVGRSSAMPSSRYTNEGEIRARSRGGRYFTIRFSSCYPLFDCPNDFSNRSRPASCCGPRPYRAEMPDNCEAEMRLIGRLELERDFLARRERAVDSVRTAYIQHCLNSLNEKFSIDYNDGLYMVTLYYYDQSGALTKTVPPKGVQPLNDAQTSACNELRQGRSSTAYYPSHILKTTYAYNSLGGMALKTSPDEGTTRFSYDRAGRTILVQNAVQQAARQASFIRYDRANRIVESGRTDLSATWRTFRDYTEYEGLLSNKAELAITKYDEGSYAFSGMAANWQKRLRNRPAVVHYRATEGADDHVVGYSYDALGNISQMVQAYPVLGLDARKTTKRIEYDHDKLNGQVNSIVYQRGKPDQFIHQLSYDANKRVREVKTTTSLHTPEHLRETEARFHYYQHGPVARIELGSEQIQGLDYAYTIQGWLKGINSFRTDRELDMGKDGNEEGGWRYGRFPQDAMAEVLNYYEGDYRHIGTEAGYFFPETPSAYGSGFSADLFNGNVQSSMMSVAAIADRGTFAQAYSYDQANRLRQSQNLFANGAGGFDAAYSPDYSMSVNYDLNGNITHLTRTGNSGQQLDDLTYHFLNENANNQLGHITENGGASAQIPNVDLGNQSSGNYSYDAIGRLTKDDSENISAIGYNQQSKVTEVRKADGNTSYAYDAFGRRISKITDEGTEWYVNDALGNQLAIYSIAGSEVRWKESGIYAGKRVGVYRPDLPYMAEVGTGDSLLRGMRNYELSDHIGNVLAVVSDRRNVAEGAAVADVRSANNYYPFGMAMPGRSFGNDQYRYGFQGMETEDDLRGTNNSYTTEFRQYDPRVGKWLSVDPKADKYAELSPYVAFLNDPVIVSDPLGDEPPLTPEQFLQNFRDGLATARQRAEDSYNIFQDETDPTIGLFPDLDEALWGIGEEYLGEEPRRHRGRRTPDPTPEPEESVPVVAATSSLGGTDGLPDAPAPYTRRAGATDLGEVAGNVATAIGNLTDAAGLADEALGEVGGALSTIGNAVGAITTASDIAHDYNDPHMSPSMFGVRTGVRVISFGVSVITIPFPGVSLAASRIIGSLVPETRDEFEERDRRHDEFFRERSRAELMRTMDRDWLIEHGYLPRDRY